MKWFLLILVALAAQSEDAAERPVAAVASLKEVRIAPGPSGKATDKGGDLAEESRLEVTLTMRGNGINERSRVSGIKLAEATDDTGQDLAPAQSTLDAAIQRELLSPLVPRPAAGPARAARGRTLTIPLRAPARRAVVIQRLRGEVTLLAGGRPESATITDLPHKLGGWVEDEGLARAGIKLRLIDPASEEFGIKVNDADPDSVLRMELLGNVAAVREIDADRDGKGSIKSGITSAEYADKKVVALRLTQPVDDSVRLRVDFEVDARAVVVPVDVAEVALP